MKDLIVLLCLLVLAGFVLIAVVIWIARNHTVAVWGEIPGTKECPHCHGEGTLKSVHRPVRDFLIPFTRDVGAQRRVDSNEFLCMPCGGMGRVALDYKPPTNSN